MNDLPMVWIVLRVNAQIGELSDVEFMGVFSTEQAAVDICKDETYCVCPAVLDQQIADERTPWEGAYFPLAKNDKL